MSNRWTKADWDRYRAANPEKVPKLPDNTDILVDPEERQKLFRSLNLCKWCGLGTHWGNECPQRPEEDIRRSKERGSASGWHR